MSAAKSNNLPSEYRPLSMWEYFGYSILYSIPVVGWVFLVIFALDNSNINRRNYSRSYFVGFILAFILFTILAATGAMAVLIQNLANQS